MNYKPHNLFFLFGFVYYLIFPVVVGHYELMLNMPAMDNWFLFFSAIEKDKIDKYLLIIFSYLLSYFLGSTFIKILPKKNQYLIKYPKNFIHKGIGLFGYIFILLVIIYTIPKKDILFTGYDTYDYAFLGILATINSVSLFFYLYLFIANRHSSSKIFLITLLLSSVILLSFGSRMYVLIPIISLFVYKLFYASTKWQLKSIIFFVLVILLILLVIGAVRIGANINSEFLLYLFLAEPTFTWWSIATFLSTNDLLVIDIPISYMSSFLNFIPSFIFEDKGSLMIKVQDIHYFEAPLGATSIFVSIQGNFGWLIGMFFIFFVGLFYSIVELYSRSNNFILTYYIVIVSVLPFQFFRDGFTILNKQIFWNMLIVPIGIFIMIIFINKFFLKIQKKEFN